MYHRRGGRNSVFCSSCLSRPECNRAWVCCVLYVLSVACEILHPLNGTYWAWHTTVMFVLLFLFVDKKLCCVFSLDLHIYSP